VSEKKEECGGMKNEEWLVKESEEMTFMDMNI
jgi:hypothetical protein